MEALLSLKKMLVTSWVCLLFLVIGSWLAASWSFAWAVMVGGVISIVSFHVSGRDVTVFVDSLVSDREGAVEKGHAKKSKKGFILKFWLRLFLIGVVLLFLIRSSDIDVFGLILGLTTVVLTVTLSAAAVVWRYYFSRR
ncbi:MAG: ATP synthase subunit I [Desulfocapsaceae bacterium]|nr:ATP synthase subunit I [Desulfocapsaceae bacterium]